MVVENDEDQAHGTDTNSNPQETEQPRTIRFLYPDGSIFEMPDDIIDDNNDNFDKNDNAVGDNENGDADNIINDENIPLT